MAHLNPSEQQAVEELRTVAWRQSANRELELFFSFLGLKRRYMKPVCAESRPPKPPNVRA